MQCIVLYIIEKGSCNSNKKLYILILNSNNTSKEISDKLFKLCDLDNSGLISLNEVKELVEVSFHKIS